MTPPAEHNRRSKNLTEEDLVNIVNALNESRRHECRFVGIEDGDLKAAIDFYKNINAILTDSKATIRRTLLVLILTTICGFTAAGVILKIRGG